MFELRGWARSDGTPAGAPRRPDGDRAVLADILERLRPYEELLEEGAPS